MPSNLNAMKSIFFIAFTVVLLFTSCKPSTTTVQEEQTAATQSTTPEATQNVNPSASASDGGHDYTFLTNKLFHYNDAVIGKPGTVNPYAGHWIDLKPDGTYTNGKLQEETGSGRWDYNHAQTLLQLRPNNSNETPSEWKVMHNDDMVVLVGTSTFGNNASQIQWVRRDERPK